jgi:Flp pilus assembly protein CpaB
MKRNMVPLLGIAFVVAIISTGIFYGLFAGKLRSSSDLPGHSIVVAARDLDRGTVIQASDVRVSEAAGVLTGSFSKLEEAVGATLLAPVKADEPLLTERVASRAPSGGGTGSSAGGGLVPAGMRALSIRVSGSEGLLALLRPGSRVDLQAVLNRENRVELRNVLQNVEVLAAKPQETAANHTTEAIVTVLTREADADVVALADAGGKIRVALRNPLDDGTGVHRALGLDSVFSNKTVSAAPAVKTVAIADGWDHPVQLHLQVLDVNDAAREELSSRLGAHGNAGPGWRLRAFNSGVEAARLIQSLHERQELEVVSSERLMAGVGSPVSYRASAAPYQLRVQFAPEMAPGGTVNLRVKPEISAPAGSGVASSKYDGGAASDGSFLLEREPGDQTPERLFPGRSWERRHLVIFVESSPLAGSSTVALARTGRER